jgi:hypothetical protein
LPAIPSQVDTKYLGTAPDITHFLPEPIPGQKDEIRKIYFIVKVLILFFLNLTSLLYYDK